MCNLLFCTLQPYFSFPAATIVSKLLNPLANQITMDCIFDYKLIQYIVCADNKYETLT